MKTITNFDINLNSLPASGENRSFSVFGDPGCVFSLEIKNEDDYYYNFKTQSFTATKARLKNKVINESGKYVGSIIFPSISDDDDYDIYLWAESNWDTKHADYSEVRFADGSIDINSSTGSSSNLLQKIIYQYTDTTITLDARSPNYLAAWSGVGITGNRTLVVGRGANSGKIPFSIIVTTAATKALRINRQPTSNDIYAYEAITMGTGQQLPGEDIWGGTAASGAVKGTVTGGNGGVSGPDITLSTTLSAAFTTHGPVGYRLTGTSTDDVLNKTVVLVTDYTSGVPSITLDTAVTIANGTTLTLTAPQYYRWSVNSSSSMHNLSPGMIMNHSTGSDVDYSWQTIPAKIAYYTDTTTRTMERLNADGSITETTDNIVNFSSLALDTLGLKPTITKGKVTKQLGNITFDIQVNEDATNRAAWFYAYGEQKASKLLGADIKFSDLKVELTKPTTTTTSGVSNSTTIPVADREGTIQNVSTISGIGINASVANPTIASATADGAGSWTASAAQTLENGITLTIEGTSRVATITGNIEVNNLQSSNFNIYFDLESFLTAA